MIKFRLLLKRRLILAPHCVPICASLILAALCKQTLSTKAYQQCLQLSTSKLLLQAPTNPLYQRVKNKPQFRGTGERNIAKTKAAMILCFRIRLLPVLQMKMVMHIMLFYKIKTDQY